MNEIETILLGAAAISAVWIGWVYMWKKSLQTRYTQDLLHLRAGLIIRALEDEEIGFADEEFVLLCSMIDGMVRTARRISLVHMLVYAVFAPRSLRDSDSRYEKLDKLIMSGTDSAKSKIYHDALNQVSSRATWYLAVTHIWFIVPLSLVFHFHRAWKFVMISKYIQTTEAQQMNNEANRIHRGPKSGLTFGSNILSARNRGSISPRSSSRADRPRWLTFNGFV
jgi:hypothetical protein